MSQNTQTKKLLSTKTNTLSGGLFNRITREYNEYLATYPGAQFGVILATLLILVSITFFLLQNVG